MKTMPLFALNEFLDIASSYQVFLAKREAVKFFNKHLQSSDTILSKIKLFKNDEYDSSYRESGISFGLSNLNIQEIEEVVKKSFELEKKRIVQERIDIEKYHKKLKYEFVEKYPELEDDMENLLINYISHNREKIKETMQNDKDISALSSRLVTFFNHQFIKPNDIHATYVDFATYVNEKYDLVNGDIQSIISKWKNERISAIEPTEKDVEIIYNILSKIVYNVNESDFHLSGFSPLSIKILKRKFETFVKLEKLYKNLLKGIS